MRKNHRTAEIRTELVLYQFRSAARAALKWVLCIHDRVAEELPRSPVEVVGARLADHVDDPAQYSAELRLITVGLDLELLNIVEDWRYCVGAKDLVGIVDPIQQEVVAAI